jgi:hypothetical protein
MIFAHDACLVQKASRGQHAEVLNVTPCARRSNLPCRVLAYQAHGACFNLGEDAEGNTLISWSALHALYTLPDGSIWAEHSDFIDSSDMVRDGPAGARHAEHPGHDRELCLSRSQEVRSASNLHALQEMLQQHAAVKRLATPDLRAQTVTTGALLRASDH